MHACTATGYGTFNWVLNNNYRICVCSEKARWDNLPALLYSGLIHERVILVEVMVVLRRFLTGPGGAVFTIYNSFKYSFNLHELWAFVSLLSSLHEECTQTPTNCSTDYTHCIQCSLGKLLGHQPENDKFKL